MTHFPSFPHQKKKKPLVVAQVTLVPEQIAVGLDAAIECSKKHHVDH